MRAHADDRRFGHLSAPRRILKRVLIRILALGLVLGTACSPGPETFSEAPQSEPIQDGVPKFSTAAEQLNFAESRRSDYPTRLRAFRAVQTLFPDARSECANAAMGLAYLHLEPAWHFARRSDIEASVSGFTKVLLAYPDLPTVQAKALWYLGWITTTLLGDPSTGCRYYWRVARDFSSEVRQLPPVMPWESLVYPEEEAPRHLPAPRQYWAEAALLEIVKSSRDRNEVVEAFGILTDRYPADRAAGFALKFMLSDPDLAPVALPKAQAYIARHPENPYLAADIQRLAKAAAP